MKCTARRYCETDVRAATPGEKLELTGFVLHGTGSYLPMLLMCGAAYAFGLLAISLLVPNIDRARETA